MRRLLDCLGTYHYTDSVRIPATIHIVIVHIWQVMDLASRRQNQKAYPVMLWFFKPTGSEDEILILFTYMEVVYCPPNATIQSL